MTDIFSAFLQLIRSPWQPIQLQKPLSGDRA
jgi:hypothetical protein